MGNAMVHFFSSSPTERAETVPASTLVGLLVCANRHSPRQEYNLRKMGENLIRRVQHGAKVVSSVEPDRYAQRFRHFLEHVLR